MDDANDDDFWYQNPGGNDAIGGQGQYQGYVNNGNSQPGNSRTGSRKGFPQGGRY